ncbi:MAG: hypothetical protein WAV45_08115 [Propionibacteriaceae bacterium]|nr:hypothetical protein [Micropruina sp.]HBX81559.1 hypothetical protein [Propionibacteriaceae bacterium]HBY24494.1 hypothetical protein [Propionibacteriaceae bacterium]
MAKRPSKHLRPARPLSTGLPLADAKGDGRWVVRPVAADGATKAYLCPGCLQTIEPGVPHVVAWPTEAGLGSSSPLDDRRHWHTTCWKRRP